MIGRVLIVDDEPRVLSALRRALANQPFQLETCDEPARALKRVEQGGIDLVLSDHDMPGMTGATFLEGVRDIDASLVRFMFTGKATLELAVDAINKGSIDRFFTKPTNHLDLAVAITKAIEQKVLLAEARLLLWKYRKQAAQLSDLEERYPDITTVDRDESGAILLDDIPEDCRELLELLGEECGELASEGDSAGGDQQSN